MFSQLRTSTRGDLHTLFTEASLRRAAFLLLLVFVPTSVYITNAMVCMASFYSYRSLVSRSACCVLYSYTACVEDMAGNAPTLFFFFFSMFSSLHDTNTPEAPCTPLYMCGRQCAPPGGEIWHCTKRCPCTVCSLLTPLGGLSLLSSYTPPPPLPPVYNPHCPLCSGV